MAIVVPVVCLFMAFMMALGARNVAYNTLTSKVPRGVERARFMSLQSAVQHLASAAGALLSSTLLVDGAGDSLGGVQRVVFIAIGLTLVAPILMRWLERRVSPPSAVARPTSVHDT